MAHKPVHCQCCRTAIWFPVPSDAHSISTKLRSIGWAVDVSPVGEWAVFCSSECKTKGAPKPVREPIQAHIDFTRDATVAFKTGAYDALGGFDALSGDDAYIKGYALGMAVRKTAEQFFKEMPNVKHAV